MLRFVSKRSVHVEPARASTDAHGLRLAEHEKVARSDWLILFAAFGGAPAGLDPVRLQQGLFLFSRCPDVPLWSKYVFKPDLYGPVSDELDVELDRLAEDGQFELVPVRGASWSLYKPTDAMFDQAKKILRRMADEGLLGAARELFELKRFVSRAGFGELLECIHTEYPEFVVNSVFDRPA
ncbi:MAG TPA: hypothetical protein VMB05_16620 [Solirubrobacteraceae bacterium]|nr:hypothetical protein [Solirubrobacteraceae bacterium]